VGAIKQLGLNTKIENVLSDFRLFQNIDADIAMQIQ